jgi:hypothetical protein
MGIQINGQTDTITAIDGALTVSGADLPTVTNLNATGIVTATGFVGNITGNINATGVSTFNDNVKLGDNDKILFGDSSDLQIYHNGSNSYVQDTGTGDLIIAGETNIILQANTGEEYIRATNNGSVYLKYDNTTKLETYTSGIIVSGGRITGADGSNFTMSVGTAHNLEFRTNDTHRLSITSSGHTEPALDNTYNLGSTSFRWANIYSADLQLSNEGSQNEIDGTWGTYTIQEGENNLFLINRRTGKRYKFLLEEVK